MMRSTISWLKFYPFAAVILLGVEITLLFELRERDESPLSLEDLVQAAVKFLATITTGPPEHSPQLPTHPQLESFECSYDACLARFDDFGRARY